MSALLQPVFLQVALTILVLFGVAGFRIIPALGDREMAREAAKGRKDVFVPRANLFVDNLQNQFEIPVLFYVAVLLAIVTEATSDWLTTLAWVFAVSRVLHALVHVTINIVPLRLLLFLVGVVATILMWVDLYGKLVAS